MALTAWVETLFSSLAAPDKLGRGRPGHGGHKRQVSEWVMDPPGVEDVAKQMRPFEQIPDLRGVSLSQSITPGERGSYQACQVPDIDGASPRHFKYHLWSPVDMWLDEGAGLLCLANSCFPKITQDWQAVAASAFGRPEATASVDGSRLIDFLRGLGSSSSDFAKSNNIVRSSRLSIKLSVFRSARS